jgi:hypothetical protein
VRPQPVWRLRIERVAAAAIVAAVLVVLMLSMVKRESPLKGAAAVAKPVTSRIHLGQDNDPAARPAAQTRGAAESTQSASSTEPAAPAAP